MKLKSFFALLAASCLAVSCTNEMQDILPDDDPKANELKLVFSSSVDGEIYPNTKAIATEEENAIDKLTIYVFGASSETGTYYYIDKWESADAQDNDGKKFVLQPSGANKKASIYPKNVTNAQYLKLYCVANSKVITGDNGTGEFTTAPGNSVTSGTNLSTFEGYFTERVTTGGNPIKTPLPMTGIGKAVHVTGNYGTVAVELKRRVARFDIDNNAARTKLTIKSVTIEQANASAYLFNTPGTDAYRYPGTKINYPEVDYTELENANLGVTTSAMYVQPTAANNSLMLVIKGLYAGKNDVTYRLKVARTPEGGSTATNLAIEPNHRYSLRIAEVTTSEIVGYFEVEDWIDGGSVEVKPDYDVKPEIEAVSGTAFNETVGNGADEDKSWTKADSTIRVDKAGNMVLKVKAPGQCKVIREYVNGFVTTRATAADWLNEPSPVVTEEDGMRVSTFTFTVGANVVNNAAPAKLTFINNAASVDSIFMLQYMVLPPANLQQTTGAISIALSPNGTYPNNNTNGTLTNTKDSEAMVLNVGKKLYVDVCSPYLAVPTCEALTEGGYLEITEVKRDAATHTVTYCFDPKTLPTDVKDGPAYSVVFTNTLDASGADTPASVTYTLELKSTETVVNAVAPDSETYPVPAGCSISLTKPAEPAATILNNVNTEMHIAFAKEMVVEVPSEIQTNVTVTKVAPADTKAGADYVYKIKIAKALSESGQQAGDEFGTYTINFKNKLDTRKVTPLALTIKKEEAAVAAKAPTDSETYTNSAECTLSTTSATAPTGVMINKANNVLYIAFDKEVEAEVPADDQTNITVTKKTTSGEFVYEIKIAAALEEGETAAGAEIKKVNIAFKNKLDTRKVTTLALSVKKAADPVED